MKVKILGSMMAILLMATAAFAGGPLIIFDAATRTPYAYAPGTVDVYTDLGDNGLLTNAEANSLTAAGFAEWTAVASSYLSAAVAGDFSAVGLPDIDGFNAGTVVGAFNGGGIHILYDDDGSITSFFFGAPPGVLGIASPDFSATGTPELLESWAMINGTAADPGDIGGVTYGGVFTHEFGHSINLAHTQTVGSVGFFGDGKGPDACATPYPGTLFLNDFETMYPFLDITPGSTGGFQATVDHPDDISALSDVYPTAGWPGTHGTITGRVFAPDGVTELTGINVIARNVADPFGDAVSALSGDFTQGDLGPDGLFTLNGLAPGADYVVYIDEIVAGGFSTSPGSIPGDGNEEYWNAAESADPGLDDPCDFTAITAAAGVSFSADIIVNGNPNDLDLGDDDFVQVALPFTFPFCGMSYTSVFVGSNGFLTFGSGDTDFSESLLELLRDQPRIAALWDDLSPNQGGSVTAQTVGADFVVTFDNVPEFLAGNDNSFSITLHADGTYEVDYVNIDAADGIAGRTEGGGATDLGPTDLSVAPQPIGTGLATVYEVFSSSLGAVDLSGATLAWDPCVIPDPPAIAVAPASLSATLVPGGMESQTLTISNIGDLDLTFEVASNDPSAAPAQGGVILARDLSGAASGPFFDDPARIAKLDQDNNASGPGKPEVSEIEVPLPHQYALMLLTEGFNAGFPAGWTAIDNEGNGVVWQVPQQLTGNHTGGTGDAAGANSDGIGPAEFDTELISPVIASFGPNVVLSYVANYQNFAFFDFLDVDITTDGGVTWTNVLRWNEDHGGFFGPPGVQVTLSLDPFLTGATEFQVRWHWYDPLSGDWDWYVQIDDVSIVSDEILVPCPFFTFAPTAGTLPGDGSAAISVDFDATGFTPGTYNCELLVFSNAVNNPRVVVPVELIVAQEVTLDIMPGKCPNELRMKEGDDEDDDDEPGKGEKIRRRPFKVVMLGGPDVDVSTIDLASIALEGVPAWKTDVKDKHRLDCWDDDDEDDEGGECTYKGQDLSSLCTGSCNAKDGYDDILLTFSATDLLAVLGHVTPGEVFQATLTGSFTNGIEIRGFDCLIVVPRDDDDGDGGGESLVIGGNSALLGAATPNPFNPVTRISYYVPENVHVDVSVYDVKGRRVAQLVSGQRTRGTHEVQWQASNVASGVYFYRMTAGSFTQTRKFILLK